jgi:hypothetical protein
MRKNSRSSKEIIIDKFLRENRQSSWFPKAWEEYLKSLELNEDTVISWGQQLKHCVEFKEGNDCLYNVHTNECREYRKHLENKWRKEYLAGPAKPSFKYPSQRKLPMPKIFGEGFFKIDFEKSIVGLRAEGNSEEQFEWFGFKRWPSDYKPQPEHAEITSVHINFVGTRARAGFHFKVPHKKSRFTMTQDQIDELRSRKYPRSAQDNLFLDEARRQLLEKSEEKARSRLKILTVDLGTDSGSTAIFEGNKFQKTELLKIIKLEKLYSARPKPEKAKEEKLTEEKNKRAGQKGLGKAHLGRHLESWVEGAKEIAEKRGQEKIQLSENDMRRLTLHTRWMIRDWVQLNTSQIIKIAEQNDIDLIVFESMRGFKLPGYDNIDDDKKRRLAFFAAGGIRHKVREKAVERGMLVMTVPYMNSSQFCSKCGKEQQDKGKWCRNKKRHEFNCEFNGCGYKGNSDENAARILGKVFWGEIKLPDKMEEKNKNAS